jgi:VanZ family protein
MNLNYRNSVWRGRILRYAPLVLWIGVVLFASTSSGSMSNTSKFIRPILEFLFPNSQESTLLIYHGYIRKAAHFTEYSALAFFASRAFWKSSVKVLRNYWYFCAIAVVAAVALTDEFNQSFNSARTGSIYDVMIDVSGGIFVVVMIAIVETYRTRAKSVRFE